MKSIKHNTHPWKPAQELGQLPDLQKALDRRIAETGRTSARQTTKKTNSKSLGKISRSLLDYASLHPYEPVYRLFQRMHKPSPATQQAAIKQLKAKKLAQFETVRLSHSSVRLMEITEQGWQFLGKQPLKQGRGGITHRHFVAWIIASLNKKGYKASREWLVPGTSHQADVAFEHNGKVTAYEVVTHTRSNIIDHVKSCFVDSDSIHTLVFVAAQKTICDQLKKLVQSDLFASEFSNHIEYQTIDTFLKEAF